MISMIYTLWASPTTSLYGKYTARMLPDCSNRRRTHASTAMRRLPTCERACASRMARSRRRLSGQSCEVVSCDEKGAAFQLLRHRGNGPQAFLYAFDLLELNGTDLRREPIEVRKATFASILRKARHGVRLNEHPCAPGRNHGLSARLQDGAGRNCSKRLGSHYRSGHSPDWLKFKNPDPPAVKREAEEDWGR